ncbi:MAG: hypothetical protein U0556_05035 [Dehalococcoidia bacterium]
MPTAEKTQWLFAVAAEIYEVPAMVWRARSPHGMRVTEPEPTEEYTRAPGPADPTVWSRYLTPNYFVVGDGKPADIHPYIFEIDAAPPHIFAKRQDVMLKAGTQPVKVKLILRQTRTGLVIFEKDATMNGEVVPISIKPTRPIADITRIAELELFVKPVDPAPFYLESHAERSFPVTIGADGSATLEIDLRLAPHFPDTRGEQIDILADLLPEGAWVVTVQKPYWKGATQIDLIPRFVPADLDMLTATGGTMNVKVDGHCPLTAPGGYAYEAAAEPVVDATVQLSASHLGLSLSAVTNEAGIATFTVTGKNGQSTGGSFSPNNAVLIEPTDSVHMALRDTAEYSLALGPFAGDPGAPADRALPASLRPDVDFYLLGVLNHLRKTLSADLTDRREQFTGNLLGIPRFIAMQIPLRRSMATALEMQRSALQRLTSNIVNMTVELIFFLPDYIKGGGLSQATLRESIEAATKQQAKLVAEETAEEFVQQSTRVTAALRPILDRKADIAALQRAVTGHFEAIDDLIRMGYMRGHPQMQQWIREGEDLARWLAGETSNVVAEELKLTSRQLFLDSTSAELRALNPADPGFLEKLGEVVKRIRQADPPAGAVDEIAAARRLALERMNTTLTDRLLDTRKLLADLTRQEESLRNAARAAETFGEPEEALKLERLARTFQTLIEEQKRKITLIEKAAEEWFDDVVGEGKETAAGQFVDKVSGATNDAHKAYSEQYHRATPLEFYQGFAKFWGVLDQIYEWVSRAWHYLADWLIYLVDWLIYLIRQLIEGLNWVLDQIVEIDFSSVFTQPEWYRGKTLAAIHGLLPDRFFQYHSRQAELLKGVVEDIRPETLARVSGVNAKNTIVENLQQRRITPFEVQRREQEDTAARYFVRMAHFLLRAEQMTLNGGAKTSAQAADGRAMIENLLFGLRTYERALDGLNDKSIFETLGKKDFQSLSSMAATLKAWGWQYFTSIGNVLGPAVFEGRVADWRSWDSAIDWIGFVAAWTLRLLAVIAITTGAGAIAGVGFLGMSAVVDLTAAFGRVALASWGTLRDVNGLIYDLAIADAEIRDAMFGDTDLTTLERWAWR